MRYWQGVIRGLKTAMVIAALSLATVACGTARTTANPVPEAGARALGLTQARTPRFRVSGYDTRGA
jgi:hypothetical protein